jgi:hypothetical protein
LLILSVRASLLWYESFLVFLAFCNVHCCAVDMPGYLDVVSLERFKKSGQLEFLSYALFVDSLCMRYAAFLVVLMWLLGMSGELKVKS